MFRIFFEFCSEGFSPASVNLAIGWLPTCRLVVFLVLPYTNWLPLFVAIHKLVAS